MSTETLKVAQNGAKLIEATLRSGALVVDRQYTVSSPKTPVPAYHGPSRQVAEVAFEEAAKIVWP
jgi:hypothetical protein